MPEIDKDFIKKRNKILLEKRGEACESGKAMLEVIGNGGYKSEDFVKFMEHIEGCRKCASILSKANSYARNAMIF